jgi:hypothetical protein
MNFDFGPHLHMGLWAAKAHVYLYSFVTMKFSGHVCQQFNT